MKNVLILFTIILSFTVSAQTEAEIEMVCLINQVRTNPKSIIPAVEAYISSAKKLKALGAKTTRSNGKTIDVITEGEALILFLNTVKPVNPLQLGISIYPFTKTHSQYLDSTKQISHIGRNGQTLTQRTKALGLSIGENCGTGKTSTDVMVQLLLDLSSSDKAHRANIFNSKYTQISVAKTNTIWVQDFAF